MQVRSALLEKIKIDVRRGARAALNLVYKFAENFHKTVVLYHFHIGIYVLWTDIDCRKFMKFREPHIKWSFAVLHTHTRMRFGGIL